MYPSREDGNNGFSPVRRSYVPDAFTVDAVLAVARYGGMNQAAKHLNVSQQTVSTRIAKFEKRLNSRIFWRGAAVVPSQK
ncbi:LysR family transcriptional regulator [Corynebacterium sp. KPL4015]|uniref:helix-turn-helix domain-containing protein n=1 Tax=Corynebacterium sp. KPL4015 TaxID=3158326 RepID=UPI0032EE9F81